MSGFVSKHPWMTFFLASSAIAAAGRVLAPRSAVSGFGSAMDASGKFYPLQIPEGFNVTIPGVVDIHGQPVQPVAAPWHEQVLGWVQANPVLVVGALAGAYVVTRKRR